MNINEALNILNISGKVTFNEVKNHYRKMTLRYHPDRCKNGLEMMQLINSAFEFLKNTKQDEFIHTEPNKAYDFSDKVEKTLTEIKPLKGLIIEICGNWIWVGGDTKNHKSTLKNLGFYWAKKKQKWYFRPTEYKSKGRGYFNMELIRERYGAVSVKNEDQNCLTVIAV